MTWLPTAGGVLAFDRGADLQCMANLSPARIDLLDHTAMLLASGPLASGQLPADSAVWLRTSAG